MKYKKLEKVLKKIYLNIQKHIQILIYLDLYIIDIILQ